MLYDIIEQDALQPKFETIPDEYVRDGTKMAASLAQLVENFEGAQSDKVAYFRDHSFVQPLNHEQRSSDGLILGSETPGEHHFDSSTGRAYYDGLGFDGYEQRWGRIFRSGLPKEENLPFPEDPREDPGYQQRKAAFFQAWLYFGLVSEFLGKFVVAADFITHNAAGKPIITLQKLLTSKEFDIEKRSY